MKTSTRRAWVQFGIVALLCSLGAAWSVRYLAERAPLSVSWFGNQTVELTQPQYLSLLWFAPLLAVGLWWTLTDLAWSQRIVSWSLRTAFLGGLALALTRPVTETTTTEVSAVFLVDVSNSVTDESIAKARDEVLTTLHAADDKTELHVVVFAEHPRLVTPERDAASGEWTLPDIAALRPEPSPSTPAETVGTATNIQAALQLAYGLMPTGKLKRVILYSDGLETDGDVLAETARAATFGIKLFARPYTEPPPAEVAVLDLTAPNRVELGQTFKIASTIYSTRATKAKVLLYQGDSLNGLGGTREVELAPGDNTISFDSVVRVGGEIVYRLVVEPQGPDRFAQNNGYSLRMDVEGRPTVLYVEGQPQRATYLASALTAQQFDVEVRQAAAIPTSPREFGRYDFVILSDVPADQVSAGSQTALESYLRDLGGGFLYAGGQAGYALGGWNNTTVARLLPVTMDAEQHKEIPSVALALVIDRSGSMAGLPLEMAKAACSATVGTLQGNDLVEVIAFDQEPIRYVKLQPARYRSRIQNDIMRITSAGGTDFFPALDMAYQDISVAQARKKHVILLTDGRAETPGVRDLVQAMLAESITVTTVGLGDGADGDLLRMIAETGGGRYHYAPDPNSLPRIFTREAELISRQADVQDWFPVVQTRSADFLKGISLHSAPLLHGYVATQMKGPPAEQILATETGDPILARWRVGLGYSLAWTSDVKNNWAVDWLRWGGFSQFWGQLVREHMRKKSHREFDMRTALVGNQLTATVDAFTSAERFDNGLRATLTIKGADGNPLRQVPMPQTAPGRYEAQVPLNEYGTFSLRAEYVREHSDGTISRVGDSYGYVSNPYPIEYQSFKPDLSRLELAARASGGRVLEAPALALDPQGESVRHRTDWWPRVVLVALVLFILDLLVRRVRLFDRDFRSAVSVV